MHRDKSRSIAFRFGGRPPTSNRSFTEHNSEDDWSLAVSKKIAPKSPIRCSLKSRSLKVVGHFLAHAAERRINIAGALQSSLNMRQDVLTSNLLQKIAAAEQLRWLVTRTAEQ